jgi:hypothetical protein
MRAGGANRVGEWGSNDIDIGEVRCTDGLDFHIKSVWLANVGVADWGNSFYRDMN